MDEMKEAEKGKHIYSEGTFYTKVNSASWTILKGISARYDS